jgi:hypothetical protein
MCGCLSVSFYKPYFDVETSDIIKRIYFAASIVLRKDDSFMGIIREKPDLYGPFWISTTLIFVIAFTSHLSSWLASWMTGKNWVYDFQSIVTAASLIYGFAFGAPAAVWVALRQYDPKFRLITITCLYGYSMFVFIPWSFVCLQPFSILSWFTLLLAFACSGLLLARNLAPNILEITGNHGPSILGIIAFAQFCFSLSLKFFFFNK